MSSTSRIQGAPQGALNLGLTLGLKPLDRLQVANRKEVAEMQVFSRMLQAPQELPYLFFQQVMPDGALEVRTGGGYMTRVDPLDVCDIIPGEPVWVRAMPRATFLARLALPLAQRSTPAPEDVFKPAMVRYVVKDRWGRIDQVFVAFQDDSLNKGAESFATPVCTLDMERLRAAATRARMPIVGQGASAASADRGVADSGYAYASAAKAFVECALSGHANGAEALANAGALPLKRARVAQLRQEAAARRE